MNSISTDKKTSVSSSISVGMGDMAVGKCPTVLFSLGLGSCIGLVLYSPRDKIAAMAHIMLPESSSKPQEAKEKPGKYADTAVPALISSLEEMGIKTSSLKAKLAGGAKMFATSKAPVMAIGEKNIAKVLEMLNKFKIPVEGQDVGGNKGRSVKFYTETCILEVKTIGAKPKTL